MYVPAANIHGLFIPHAGMLGYSLLEQNGRQRPIGRHGVYVPAGLGITKSSATSFAFNTAGTTLLSFAGAAGPGAPFVAAAGAVAILAGQIAKAFGGCGGTCTASTQLANDWSDAVNEIKRIYWGTPTPRYRSFQQSTLDQLTQAADWLRTGCSDISLKEAGKRCISERLERGGTAPWCPTADHKGCDFYTVIYDPIANDPNVVDDPPGFAEDMLPFMGGGSNSTTILLVGGLALLLLLTQL